MKYTKNSINIYTVKSFKGIGLGWINKNLKGNESVETIVSLLNSKIQSQITVSFFNELCDQNEQILTSKFGEFCDGFSALGDPKFPAIRGLVKDSERPVFLYYKGNLDLLASENKNITVIGLLNPEGDIEIRERRIVSELVKKGATIVSGLAFGCDSISHEQALDSNGTTIAVLPSPLNDIMPKKNTSLAYKIVEEGGLLITEYGETFKNQMELSSRYKERDRLQALFCDTIILAASYSQDTANRWNMHGQKLDSGARLAMGFAKDYNISRAVMYDSVLDERNPMFDLNREILMGDKNVTTISEENMIVVISELLNKSGDINKKSFVQSKLFN